VASLASDGFLRKGAAVIDETGNGDREVVFALIGLGGEVNSADISERRPMIAGKTNRVLELAPASLMADVTDLVHPIETE